MKRTSFSLLSCRILTTIQNHQNRTDFRILKQLVPLINLDSINKRCKLSERCDILVQ